MTNYLITEEKLEFLYPSSDLTPRVKYRELKKMYLTPDPVVKTMKKTCSQ
jgi:hypothetical protein